MFITLRNVSESVNVTQPKFRSVSAHVSFQSHVQSPDNNFAQSPELLSMAQPGGSVRESSRLHIDDLKVTSGRLHINAPGTYFVYSSMHFKPRVGTFGYKLWEHNISLNRENRPDETLAHSCHSCFTDCDREVHTSYTGGVFQLRHNDLVYVNVTSKDLVAFDGQASYLGLIMIASSDGA
ncbi:unnamed protein product [Candidula unifasciata]|uniref:THD domain-containing protein n=1 Tax=Candidula unifasciata TaxID=100452 RepID=A0A8S3YIH0_9EUPU|nr:unnamed protein product [Candidula unifasciata]